MNKVLLLSIALFGCASRQENTQIIQTPTQIEIANRALLWKFDISNYLSPDLPPEEIPIMWNVLRSVQPMERGEKIIYFNPNGKLHTNDSETLREIRNGTIGFEYNTYTGP